MNRYYHKTMLAAGYGKNSEEYKKLNRVLNQENKKFRRKKKSQEKHEIIFNYMSSFTDEEEDNFDCFASDEDVEEKVFHEIEMDAFRKCLRELSNEDREFLMMLYRGDRSIRQISRDTGIAFSSLIYRRDKLFNLLRKKMLAKKF